MPLKERLKDEYLKRKKLNPAYSLRAYASSLDLNQSFLSKILKGKRQLSQSVALKISQKLGLESEVVKKYLAEISPDKQSYQDISVEVSQLLSHWEHFAILELIKTKGFKQNSNWIAKRLGLSTLDIEVAVERLIKFGYIEIKNKKWTLGSPNNTWTDLSVTSDARMYYQKKLLEKALHAIDTVPFDKRENASLTIQCSPELLPEIKIKLKQFRHELDKYIEEQGSHKEVYQLIIGFYPLTQNKDTI